MNKILLNFSIAAALFSVTTINAQNIGINGSGAAPNGDAMLDVSSTTKGLLIPRVNIANLSTIAPVTGGSTTSLLVYNTNATSGVGYYYWNGTKWVNMSGDDWKLTGNSGTVAGTNFLGTLDNVDLTIRRQNGEKIRVLATTTSFMDEIQTRDGGANSGDVLVKIYDSSDDGIIDVNENGAMNIRLHGNGVTVFNDQQISTNDFRIETSGQNDMFFVDAGTNRIGINTTSPASPVHFKTTGENVWLTYWLNDHATNGALAQWSQSSTTNGSRVAMGVTNYSGSANAASGIMGLSLNNTTSGSGGIGVVGHANNEDGDGVRAELTFSGFYSGWALYTSADVFTPGGVWTASDKRFKKDIQKINGAIAIINKLKPVSYYFDTEKYGGIGFDEDRLTYGFLAQELEQVIPELVKDKRLVLNSNKKLDAGMSDTQETGIFKVVNYTMMVPVLTQAIKEQQVIIESQDKRLDELEKLVKELMKNKE